MMTDVWRNFCPYTSVCVCVCVCVHRVKPVINMDLFQPQLDVYLPFFDRNSGHEDRDVLLKAGWWKRRAEG